MGSPVHPLTPQIVSPILVYIHSFVSPVSTPPKLLKYFPSVLLIWSMINFHVLALNEIQRSLHLQLSQVVSVFFPKLCYTVFGCGVLLISYCTVVTNYHKYSGLKQHKIITVQLGG